MRYSIFAGGKRLRPALCLAAAEACRGSWREALPLACAVECIHTYSLIHDDLPAMDNDDYRRGKLTNHKVFGEGIAVLAGDALLTEAFAIAGRAAATPRYSAGAMLQELWEAAGSRQLIAGQVADLEGEGKKISAAQLRYIHERKTAALLRCSVRLGGMSANCPPAQLAALGDFGLNVGLAFQIIDDILDVTQTSEQLGKTAGKDTPGAEGHLSLHRRPGKIAANGGGPDRPRLRRAAHFQGPGARPGGAGRTPLAPGPVGKWQVVVAPMIFNQC